MSAVIAIAAGGSLGALLRYGCTRWLQILTGSTFPFGTLSVNVIGSLLMGFGYIWLLERSTWPPEARLFLLTGLLGAFTTFSAFSVETLMLIEDGHLGQAFANILLNVFVCLAAAWLGMNLGRQL